MQLIVIRDVTVEECPWLRETVERGRPVWEYGGYTYQSVSPAGVAVSFTASEDRFCELPRDALGYEDGTPFRSRDEDE